MSENCQYLVFPGDDWGPYVVEAHPHAALISDDLGGAFPVAISMALSRSAMWVRETAATEGSPRNITASVVATLLAGWARPIMVLGPAVLTSLVPLARDLNGDVLAAPEGFSSFQSQGLAVVAGDIRRAIAGSDGPFESDSLPDGWAAKVRDFADRIRTRPIADDWPDSECRIPPPDSVCGLLEKAYPGRRFAPVAVPTPIV